MDNIQFAQEMESVSGAVVTSIEPLLQSLAGEILKLSSSEVPRSKNFLDFGFDSTSLVLFARRIGDSLGIEISPAELFARPTIAQLAKSLDNRVSAPAQHSNHKWVTSSVAMLAAPKQQLIPSNTEPIAIIGMAGVLPGSPDLAAFWDHLASGHDLISEAPRDRWDWRSFESGKANEPNPTRWGGFLSNVDQFDPLFFGISPREAALMDPQQRLFLEVAWHAIEDAGYGPSHIAGTRTGLYVGVATSDYADLLRAHAHDVESQMATGIAHSILANRVSYLLDFRGPSQPVDTACSSSLVAIHHAVEAIRQGICEMAIAGGVNVILSPILSLGFGRAGFMSPSGRCRAFSKEGDGYVRGEGAGAIFLKPLTRALRDRDHIHAVIRGTAVNHGGRSASLTAPNSEAQTELLVNAWRRAGVPADSISYIEAHGTGTALGDPIEILGLKEALEKARIPDKSASRALPCWIGSVKSNLGHLEAASGIAGVLKTALALQHRQIPASLHAHEVNPFLPLAGTPIQIVQATMSWPVVDDQPRRAGVSSFGFGGANAHIVLEEAPEDNTITSSAEGPILAVLSARNQERLQAYASELASFLQTSPVLPLADVCFTLCYGRDTMEARWAAEVSALDELISKLQSVARAEVHQEQLPAFVEEWLRNGTPLPPTTANGRRVSLPGYPFARERHWFNVSRLFTVTLDPQEERIAHHLVGGRLVCAGAVLLNVALEAITPNPGVGLKHWNWIKPVVLEATSMTLHIHVAGSAIRLESEGGDVHAQGELSQPQPWQTARLNVPNLPPGLSPDALYDTFAAEGVLYGSWFRRIDRLSEVADGEVWAHYEIPSRDSVIPSADLLDAAWQAASFLRLRTEPGLPFALTDLSWSGPLPTTGWICAKSEGTRLSIEIAAEDGSVVVRLGELVLREWTGDSGLIAAIPEWRPKPTNYVEPHSRIWHLSGVGWESTWGKSLAGALSAASLTLPYEASSATTVEQVCYLAGTESGLTETEQFFGFLQTLLTAGYGNRSLTLVVMTRQAQASGRELQ
ncbi:MAG: polyketide synthase dehydratase domain-containing protein, partial [Acidobacteriaceae bacterium]|nr:polyketide synthase dehydratase domain-containing protein [Acidobacteriaceae bacterium]